MEPVKLPLMGTEGKKKKKKKKKKKSKGRREGEEWEEEYFVMNMDTLREARENGEFLDGPRDSPSAAAFNTVISAENAIAKRLKCGVCQSAMHSLVVEALHRRRPYRLGEDAVIDMTEKICGEQTVNHKGGDIKDAVMNYPQWMVEVIL